MGSKVPLQEIDMPCYHLSETGRSTIFDPNLTDPEYFSQQGHRVMEVWTELCTGKAVDPAKFNNSEIRDEDPGDITPELIGAACAKFRQLSADQISSMSSEAQWWWNDHKQRHHTTNEEQS